MSTLKQKKHLQKLLSDYKTQVDQLISDVYGQNAKDGELKEPLFYALSGAGKRFRPSITLVVADCLKNGLSAAYSALAIELFHTASLVADDLPIMDDDPIRRNRPSLHTKFGESTALLTSYALMGEGYLCVLKNKKILEGKIPDLDMRSSLAIEMLAQNNGLEGAPHGQYLDLYPPTLDQKTLDLIFYRKTVLFFETAFALGWLFGGGDLNQLEKLKQGAYHFGMAFQIYDDFGDLEQDQKKSCPINYPLVLGKEFSLEKLKGHIEQCDLILNELQISCDIFSEMLSLMHSPAS